MDHNIHPRQEFKVQKLLFILYPHVACAYVNNFGTFYVQGVTFYDALGFLDKGCAPIIDHLILIAVVNDK